ncbi:M23 family metallopeptidase [Qipengyuania sp. 1NDH17]|uniref:M23 family metallopeptidase n=1 Tax=Qipengyuania polymorpha TaxID=2867234 RepID=A0ABS7IZ40_9SPHN|nr:M23 family metallopeptidase [Qipengyuania polymorpha]MBX7458683.1 M23 family metallopeptidase [Qipengyuania polymorpha]
MLLTGLIFQNMVLLALVASLFLAGRPTRLWRLLYTASAGALVFGIVLSGVWVYPPIWGAAVYLVLFLLACLRWWRMPVKNPARLRSLQIILAALTAIPGLILIWQGVAGRIAPAEEAIELSSPFAEVAGHCVLSGGSSLALNLHYVESDKTAASYEKHSVDFIRLNRFGFRTLADRSLSPKPAALGDYAVYGSKVVAPCDGVVSEAVDGKPDVAPGHANRSLDGSNYVLLQCKAADVLLAHFQPGTLAVDVGGEVTRGQPLGLAGNSGNTEEPHLHINAQRQEGDGTLTAVPMRFDGRYLARGDCL